ncbi:hypothetical protein K2173_003764 [Erythroxylum novogranatense]|uniref:Reverse transcriptase n=1 Tax=Erythroxylum novogranatense TaxID=1862640 RepID=A0AAV8SIQ3_9ROSI|nr:hypothetical protein K2173_003764 [Erythroxylum novogranatense]
MGTRQQTNAEFRNEVQEALGRHESLFDQIQHTLQTFASQTQNIEVMVTQLKEQLENVNPFAPGGSNQHTPSHSNFMQNNDHHSQPLFPQNTNNGQTSQMNPQVHYTQTSNPFPQHHSHLKLQFPKFDGTDPQGWAYKAEQYFEFTGVPPKQHVQLTSFHLEGIALQWHRWLSKFQGPLTWEELTRAIFKRFGPTEYDPSEALSRLKQTTTVVDYQQEFEKLSHRVDNLPASFLVGSFIAGLREEIRLDVKIKQPRTLSDAIGVTRLVEERNLLQKKQSTTSKPSWSSKTITPSLLVPAPSAKTITGTNNSPPPFRRISGQEAKERRDKGLCYYCDEKYILGHRCNKPQLFAIEDVLEEAETETGDDRSESEEVPEISLHAIAGMEHPQTIQLAGTLKGMDVTILVDSGSTHNFVDQSIVKLCGLTVAKDQTLRVMVANRDQITCQGMCQGVSLTIQGYRTTADFFVLPSAACPIVLGVQWMATLGPIQTDYKTLTMTIKDHDKSIIFQGMRQGEAKPLSRKECNLHYGTIFLLQVHEATHQLQGQIHPQIQKLLVSYSQVFKQPQQLPPISHQDHHIPLLEGSKPVSVRPYRYPFYQKTEIEKMVQELLTTGLIRPNRSPFSSPVLLVKKFDGSSRFCFPIPIIDELLDELHGSMYYTKLDLRSGYHQIRVKEEDIHKTAFRTHEGHYEFIVMPFGLTNAPATFQALMNEIFRPYLRKFILVFFDDILVYNRCWEEHLYHLEVVLQVLQTNQLFVKTSKCQFGVMKVDYLGHAILAWPTPTTQKAIRGFLGLAGYYQKFIQNFGIIAAPLTKLLTKQGFTWTNEAETTFQQLRKALSTPPVLALPDFSQEFEVESDACGSGLGAILSQKRRPIAYYSEALKGSALHLSTYEKEMLAIVKAIRKWRPYLLGKPFIVRTDQRSFNFLLEQRITTPTQARWLPKLMGYDYRIEYRKGRDNQGADALSRMGEYYMTTITLPIPAWWKDLQEEVRTDPAYATAIQKLPAESIQVKDGVYFYKGRIFLLATSSLIPSLLSEYHSSATGGHFGYQKSLAKLKQQFYWPPGLLQPLPIPAKIWSNISVDFVEGLPSSKGFTAVMTVVDRLTKYCHFVPLKHPFTTVSIANELVNHVIKLHGIPETIVSDRDKIFTKVMNRMLEQYLRCFISDQPRKWVGWLAWAELSYNTSYHSATNFTPFELVYGRPPPSLLSYVPGTTKVQSVDDYLRQRAEVLKELKLNLRLAQEKMKLHADKKRREVEFNVGDYVYLKLQPYRQTSVAFRKSLKLSARFYGPFEILEKIGKVAYRLRLPEGAQIHDVFHISLLKRHLGEQPTTTQGLPPSHDSHVLPEPDQILDRRVIREGRYRPYRGLNPMERHHNK